MTNKIGSSNHYRILFKTAFIAALILLLLIPTYFIQNLVSERQERRQDAIASISAHWAASQTVTGPVIGIPYIDTANEDGSRHKRWAYFLPAKLNIRTHLVPEKRYRGIYQVIVYTSEMDLHASFDGLNLQELGLSPGDMLWKEATVFLDITDPQGLNEDLMLHLQTANPQGNNTPHSVSLELTPKVSTDQFKNAFNATLPSWISAPDANGVPAQTPLEFSASIRLKGSGDLLFFPGGRETTISASSSWSSPSFIGSMLPDLRTVKDSGFAADWKVLAINRKFPQQWKKTTYNFSDSSFGVDLFVPVDAYQQITRTVKYALLIIVLTFTAFLLIEWICHLVIHVFQYILVGFALCIFYTLLLSMSEYLGFSLAYFLAGAATICLVAWYMGSLLHSRKLSLFVAFLLSVQYGFLYTLIQLEDYALLMGSIGLFVILALVMYFSRKINWEQKSPAPEDGSLA